MRKIISLSLLLLFISCGEEGYSQKEKCEIRAEKADGSINPEFGGELLLILNRDPVLRKNYSDPILLMILNYQNKIRKCRNKSDYLP